LGTNSANFVKIAQGIRPWGVYIPNFGGKFSVKISVWGPIPLL